MALLLVSRETSAWQANPLATTVWRVRPTAVEQPHVRCRNSAFEVSRGTAGCDGDAVRPRVRLHRASMKRPALGSSLRVRIPCGRTHAWADDLSSVGPMAAFAVKRGVGTPRIGLRRPLPSVDLRGPRDAKEHPTIACRGSRSVGRWMSSPWNADGYRLRHRVPQPRGVRSAVPWKEPASRETRTTAVRRGGRYTRSTTGSFP